MERLDVRLVPSALTAWAVSAAGIVWGLGWWLAGAGVVIGAGWVGVCRVAGKHRALLRTGLSGVLATAAVGTGFGIAVGLRSDTVAAHPLAQRFGTSVWVDLVPVETPRGAGPGRVMFRADLLGVGERKSDGTVLVFGPAIEFGGIGPGQPARFRSRIARPARRDLTVAVLTAVGRPHIGQAPPVQTVARAVRDRFAATARDVLPAAQAAVLPGLVLGDTSAVPAAVTTDFRRAGLTHLMAVSGANVTIVCAAVLLSGYLLGPRIAVGLAALALVGFVIVVQPSPSVLRAAVMGAIGLMAVLSGRRRRAMPVLAAAVLALMLIAPQLAVDAGFALSVSATAALVLLAPVWSTRLVGRGWPKPLADAVCIAAAAQLATAPLIAAISGQFSVVSVLANVIAGVVIAPITVLGTMAAALVCGWPQGAGLLIRFTGPEVWWLLEVAQTAGRTPGAAVGVPTGWAGAAAVGAAGLAGVLMWRWRWFRLAAGAAALCGVAWSVSGLVGGA